MKNEIIELSKKLKIDLIGFTKFENKENPLIKEKRTKGLLTPFNKSYDPSEYEGFNTAIVIGVSYYNEIIEKVECLPTEQAYFSLSSWGKDYHVVLKEKLKTIEDYLKEKNYKTKICVDNNSLDERYYASKSGIGYYGINSQIINDEFGSFIFLGILLTDAILENDEEIDKTCLECMKCVNECPTNAIGLNGEFNGNRCLSYITQKKDLTDEEYNHLNRCIYGCDICGLVCPLNTNLKTNNNFIPYGIEFIDVKEYKEMSNKEFKEKYNDLSGSWRGKKVIERNIKAYKEKLEKLNSK